MNSDKSTDALTVIENELWREAEKMKELKCSGFQAFDSVFTSFCNFLRQRTDGRAVCVFPRYVNDGSPGQSAPKLVCNCVPLAKLTTCPLTQYAAYRETLEPWSTVCPSLPALSDLESVD